MQKMKHTVVCTQRAEVVLVFRQLKEISKEWVVGRYRGEMDLNVTESEDFYNVDNSMG